MKSEIISNYIQTIDFDGDNWSINQIKESLRNLLGETPAIKVNYVKDVMINEIKGTAEEFKKMESVTIIYTDVDNKLKKTEFRLGV